MYFKRIEMVGFKSFATKTKLKFESGVTAIVGPNGCGKSNIIDAIKWVLGEQSAKELRGSRMEDVIFNGTQDKEPINMAEVSIVLSNEDKHLPIDYEEVIITRRLFRSGESEYLINKTPARLKDISDLLAGTGIGTSAYSIIEQGQIGQILSSKPEERRHLLEEASGITKFKLKKKEALKKLEHTESNLLRINDIITEVERQIRSIERQAKKAELYRENFDVLKDLELKYSRFRYNNITNELKTISVETGDLKKAEEELLEGHSALLEDTRASKNTLEIIDADLLKTEMAVTEASASIDKNAHTVLIDKERIEEFKNLAENLKKDIEALEKKLAARKKDLDDYEKNLRAVTGLKTEKEGLLNRGQARIGAIERELAGFHAEIKKAKVRIFDCLSSHTKAKNEAIKLDADMQNGRARLRRLKVEKENLSKEKESLSSAFKGSEEKYNSAKDYIDSRHQLIKELKSRLEDLEKDSRLARETKIELAKNKEALKSKIELLTEMALSEEGFSESVKTIKNENRAIQSLSEIIKVDSCYEGALSAVLGETREALIVDEKEEAFRLINLVKNKNLGRISFICHKEAVRMKPRHPRDKLKNCPPLLDFIKYDEEKTDMILCLLNDVYVAASEEEADAMLERFRDLTFVTLNGYVRQGAKISGGVIIEAGVSPIGRKEKIENLKKEALEIDSGIAGAQQKQKNIEEALRECRIRLNGQEEDLRARELEFSDISAERASLLNQSRKIADEETVVSQEIRDDDETLGIYVNRQEELNIALKNSDGESAGTEALIHGCEQSAKDRQAEKENLLLEIANIKGDLGGIISSYDNIRSNHDIRKQECDDIAADMESKKDSVTLSSEKSGILAKEIVGLNEKNIKLEADRKALKTRLGNLKDRKDLELDEFRKKEAILKEKQANLENLRNNLRDLEIKMTEINYKKTSLVDRIAQGYSVDLNTLEIEIEENTDWEEAKIKIEALKDKIQKMGPVNLVAIEEHKELEERFQFLTRQREDLVNAKDSLHKAIIKINATTRKLFMETFEKVQVEFRNYFRMLFGGGHAEIFLMDEGNILECGIEIVARPPGKKLQNILLLSGGEKALTAISLLFAIFKVHPSPFCVLDEIDAPLDESNIERFSRVLQEFIKMSQFIMITHNKRTIQMADILYGITMAEKGVSRIVSVKFSEAGKEDNKEEVMV